MSTSATITAKPATNERWHCADRCDGESGARPDRTLRRRQGRARFQAFANHELAGLAARSRTDSQSKEERVNMTKKSNKQLKAKLAKARVEIKGRFERADVRRQFDVGDIIQFSDGKRYEVLHRNQSRARVRALDRVERNGVNQITNEPFHFSFAKEFDISAGAEAKIVGHTGRKPAPIKR